MHINSTFWLVWSPQGEKPPRHRHLDEESALAEAERLARLHPGKEFIVLQSVESRLLTDLLRVDLRPDNRVPF